MNADAPKSARPLNAREVATEVLFRVAKDDAYAAPTLDAALQRGALSRRDRALATTLVYDTLRVVSDLDREINRHLKKRGALDPYVRAALRVATFALLHLSRVPARATVNETVALVRKKRGRPVSGFVNAVLRKIAAGRPESPERPTSLSLPKWIRKRLVASVGAERAEAFTSSRTDTLDLCVLGDRDAVARSLVEHHPELELTPGQTPTCLKLRRAGDPRELHGYADGDFFVQEEGSQEIARLVNALPGEHVGDLCAGRGGKTLHFARDVGATGQVTAIELHEARVEQISARLQRSGLRVPVALETIDLTVGTGGFDESFDRVLVDAPCSGLGTAWRRPELLLRITPAKITELALLQRQIVDSAARCLKPGGLLIYAVCSFLSEERVDIPHGFDHVGLDSEDADGVVRLGAWRGTDAYQIFCSRKPGSMG